MERGPGPDIQPTPETVKPSLKLLRYQFTDPKIDHGLTALREAEGVKAQFHAMNVMRLAADNYANGERQPDGSRSSRTPQEKLAYASEIVPSLKKVEEAAFEVSTSEEGFKRAQYLHYVQWLERRLLGTEPGEKVTYPPGTTFQDVLLSKDDVLEIAENLNGLSHDTRTPLAGVVGYTQMLDGRIKRGRVNLQDLTETDLQKIDNAFAGLKRFTEKKGVEVLTNGYPKDEMSGLSLDSVLQIALAESTLPQVDIRPTQFMVDEAGCEWLQKLKTKVLSDPDTTSTYSTQLLVTEIDKVLDHFQATRSVKGLTDIPTEAGSEEVDIQVGPDVSTSFPLILSNIKWEYSEGDLEALAANVLQNFGKAKADILTPYITVASDFVKLNLADNGAGLHPEFKGIDEGSTGWVTEAKGTGLGLAGIKKRAKHYNGDLELIPGPHNIGAVTVLTLPLTD